MSLPQISVIVPIYNTEKYLRNCLLSLQNQTMEDFEAILVNDCSPDNSLEIVNDFVRGDSRFSVLQHEHNQGLGSARNTGIKSAYGKYLNFLDSDDSLPTNSLQILLEQAKRHNADMVIGNMAWKNFHYLSPVNYIDKRIQTWVIERTQNLRLLSEKACLSGSICNRLIRTKLVKEKLLLFPLNVYFEDIPFTMIAWYFSNTILTTPHFIYFRTKRENPNNLSITQIYNEKAFFDRDTISQLVFEFASENVGAARLGAITLMSMLSTTKTMLDSVNEEINLKIKIGWFPKHTLRINQMINHLNEISSRQIKSVQKKRKYG